jgi:hypothetical protein
MDSVRRGQQKLLTHGWTIRLKLFEETDQIVKNGPVEFALSCDAKNQLLLSGQRGGATSGSSSELVMMEKDETAEMLPTIERHVAEITPLSRAGQMWEGLIQYPGAVAQKLRVSFMENRDQGNYVRVLLERPDHPSEIAIFEGTLGTSADTAFAWPIRVSKISDHGLLGARGKHPIQAMVDKTDPRLKVCFTPQGELLLVTVRSGVARLKAVKRETEFESSATRWRTALAAGTRWSGKVVRGDRPADPIVLTVAEVLESGRIYQLTLQNPDDPHQFRSFMATLEDSDKAVDTYALTLKPTSVVGHAIPTLNFREQSVYGTNDTSIPVRMTADGLSLFTLGNIKQVYEEITLTRDKEPAEHPLDHKTYEKAWRDICVTGSRWRGPLTNSAAKQTTDVELAFVSGVDEQGNVTVEMRLASDRKNAIRFAGTLALDENSVRGFALKLAKKDAGKGTSAVFGQDTRDIWLYLRLNESRTALIGMAGSAPHRLGEFLELKRVESIEDESPVKKPTTKPSTPTKKN